MRVRENTGICLFIKDVLGSYGTMVVIFVVLLSAFGDYLKDASPMFSLGSEGIPINLLRQLLLLGVLVKIYSYVLLTDKWIKNMSAVLRNILFAIMVTITVVVLVIVFRWFSITSVSAWSGFFTSFGGCFAIGIISSHKAKVENERMNKALEEYMKDHNR